MIISNTETRADDAPMADRFLTAIYRGRNLAAYDDGFGDLYVYGAEHGPARVIRAQSWQDAYDIAIDESPTIDESEVSEAFCPETGDLFEGYRFQSNASGTGIVDVGFYEWLQPIGEWNERVSSGLMDAPILPVFVSWEFGE